VVVGKHSRKFARATVEQLNTDNTYYLCSNNEHCLDELFKLRKLRDNWKIGITGPFTKSTILFFWKKAWIARKYRFMLD
jgi:hypothetical protein